MIAYRCADCGVGVPLHEIHRCHVKGPRVVIDYEPLYIPATLEEINDILDIAKAKVECFEKIKAIKERRK